MFAVGMMKEFPRTGSQIRMNRAQEGASQLVPTTAPELAPRLLRPLPPLLPPPAPLPALLQMLLFSYLPQSKAVTAVGISAVTLPINTVPF